MNLETKYSIGDKVAFMAYEKEIAYEKCPCCGKVTTLPKAPRRFVGEVMYVNTRLGYGKQITEYRVEDDSGYDFYLNEEDILNVIE